MKQFNLNKDENILSSQKGSKQYIVSYFILTIAMAVIAIVLILNIPSIVGQNFCAICAIEEAIFITLSITIFCDNLNQIIKTVTTRVILTDQRIVYIQSGINAKNVEIPVNQIKCLYFQMDSIFDESTGEITVYKKNDSSEELPYVENAFDIEKNFTRHIVNKALNNR